MPALILIGLLLGVAMLWVFAHTSNQGAIKRAKNRLYASLYEMRLFADEPALVWKAQVGLLSNNLRYIGLMLVPAIIVTVPMVVVFAFLEAWYGMAPLPPGRQALVTMQVKTLDPAAAPPTLTAPPEIAIESPPVRDIGDRQVSWRIRPSAPVSGVLHIVLPDGGRDENVDKNIEAGQGRRYLSDRRVRGLLALVLHPAEARLPPGNVEWIEVHYPPATVRWLGISLHWLIWLLIFSMLGALLLKNRFKVTF
ncbi:MAG TPA: hypothetical protein VKR61_10310 [Bryobacteraceae bacterium]|nr:hypothetical protein [Bryobacteraceae bacterium]